MQLFIHFASELPVGLKEKAIEYWDGANWIKYTSVSIADAANRMQLFFNETISSNSLYFSDGGEFGQWAQSRIPFGRMFVNGLSGAIGGATPQSIGASFANPGLPIVSFMGDGTAGFQIAEWETATMLSILL